MNRSRARAGIRNAQRAGRQAMECAGVPALSLAPALCEPQMGHLTGPGVLDGESGATAPHSKRLGGLRRSTFGFKHHGI